MRARPKTLASVTGVVASAVLVTGMAVAYEGLPTAKVELNDAGVWLTNTSNLLVGHFNSASTIIDGGMRAGSDRYDVLQDAETVLIVDDGGDTVSVADPARMVLTDSAPIPAEAKVALGAKTTAVLNSKSGELWVTSAKGLSGFDMKGLDPVAELGDGADVTVGRDGTVYALSGERGEVVTIPTDAEGLPLDPQTSGVGEIDLAEKPSITVVGTTPVVLDAAAGVVTTPGGFRTEIPGAKDAVLQQASADADGVALATTSALYRVPFESGEATATEVPGTGNPAQPVQLRGCTYAAWAGSARFIRDCAGDAQDVDAEVPGAQESAELKFRVNRDVIVLNDVMGGAAWMANKSLQRVDDWSVLVPPEGESEEEEENTKETVETSLPKRTEKNTNPTAEDDTFGVRPGGSTLLPVVDNDNDTDGDVLSASLAGKQPSIGSVQPIFNGAALQIDVPEDAQGAASFEYEVDDGRGGTDTAIVSLTVYDWKTNTAPKPKRTTKIAVETGGTVSYNVLPDWIDPEGDDVYLRNVTAAPGDEVEFTTDGQITYKAIASMQGRKTIEILVADAQGETANGTIVLDVKPAGSTNPVTNADHVVTRVGETITVAPLTNDSSSSQERLRLARVDGPEGPNIVPDYPNAQFTFRAAAAGTYYVQYLANAGPKQAEGLVRVDVLDARESELPPVAVRDVALLPKGSEALVGVLGNDSDPAGGVLVVQSVTVPPQSGVSVSVLNHETLRITDEGAFDEQVRISYRISNGSKSAQGDVIVIPIPAPSKLMPPVANDDEVIVRAGDVVTIPVLDNDVHPNDDALHVLPELAELPDPEAGEAFVSQDTVRFRAGPKAQTVYLTYEAVDSMGQKDGGLVTVQILPLNDKTNAAPRPRDLTARALAGATTNIPVPLDGLDADGDSVELLGIDEAPSKGRISEVGPNFLTYEAFDGSTGVDTFSYRVRDRLGQEGVASIRVGVAPPEALNQAPYAVRDSVIVRPGRSVAVPVLVNDSDPEGDRIGVVKDGLVQSTEDGVTARVSGDRVIIEVPDRELETSLQYTIRDAKGGEATAPISVTVDKNVPLMTPVARDDRVRVEDLEDGLSVDLDILENDEDPDGTVEGLTVEAEPGATLLPDRKARVTVTEQRQLIRYTVTDQDDRVASAFIFVPAISELRPSLSSTKPLEVKSGETRELPLSEYVTVAGGGDVRLTEAAKVRAVNANGDSLIKDETTLVYTSKDGYFGDDALTFEVTDGADINDPKGRKATLTIPITVLPPDNQQPVFTNSQMTVAPGEKATPLDLAALTTDPDPKDAGKIKFRITDQPGGGVSARLDGSTLLAEAASNTRKGTTVSVGLEITDGTTEPVEGSVEITVTASTRSLAVATPDTVAEADQGKSISVPVLRNDINPFAAEGDPLKLVSASIESGQGSAKAVGDEVEITPGAKFVGVMVVRYRIQDATKDPDREVDGRVTVTVQGVPDAPGKPTVSAVEDRTVVLAWSSPSNNGAEITQYTVKSVSGRPYSKTCSSTTCTLDGLTNNVEYTFTVTAHNRVGEGPASPVSAPARPDTRPDTPIPPTLAFGDRSLKVAWTTPPSSGSPVDSYTLEISPTPPSGIGQKSNVTGNSLVWENLENGTSYTVRVRAHNQAPEPSEWSNPSLPMVPAGPPGTVAAPTVQNAPAVGSEAQMTVHWNPAPQNGDAIRQYQVTVYRGGAVFKTITVPGGQTSVAVPVPTNTTDYTYSVRAENKAGWGAQSPQSAAYRAVGPPGAPTAVTARPADRAIHVTFTPPSGNGARGDELRYQYLITGGGWTNWNGTSPIPANNGTTYTVQVRAYSVVGGAQSNPGPAGTSGKVVPFGPPHAPTGSATKVGDTSIRLSWNAKGSANGRPVTVYTSIDGGSWVERSALTGSVDRGDGYNQTHSIKVRVVASEGGAAESPTYKATTSAPNPRAWVERGNSANISTCGDSSCSYFKVVTNSDFKSGSYTVKCMSANSGQIGSTYENVQINANSSKQLLCIYGYPGVNVWVNLNGKDYEKRGW